MSCNLITYMVRVPATLNIAEVDPEIRAFQTEIEAFTFDEDGEPQGNFPDWYSRNMSDSLCMSHKEYFEWILQGLDQWPKNFINLWSDSLPDTNSRFDPHDTNYRWIVAGDNTWGDEPHGDGYQLLKLIVNTPLADLLGVE